MTGQLVRSVRKYTGGGLGDMQDPGIPRAQVEIYLRSREGETFYVPTLAEGILHLISQKGYRLGISYYPDGASCGHPEYKITIWRFGNELQCDVFAPMLDSLKPSDQTGKLHYKLDYQEKLGNALGKVEFLDLGQFLGLTSDSDTTDEVEEETADEFVDRLEQTLDQPAPQPQYDYNLLEEEDVIIDGTQLYFE